MRATGQGARAPALWVAVGAGSSLCLVVVLLAVLAPPTPRSSAADHPPCTISPKLVNSCRPWLGAESGGYGVTGFRDRMLEHEARIGRQVDIVHAYAGEDEVLSSDVASLATRPATIALLNWRVSMRWAEGGGGNPLVNARIDAMAESIKALDSTRIMLTLYHEPESSLSAGGAPGCGDLDLRGTAGSSADYVAMWRNVQDRFDELGVTNVVWVMTYTGWHEWNCAVKDLWPGNDLVDWVMWDPYPRNASWTETVDSFYDFLTDASDDEHDFLSKAWGLAEFGYVGDSQDAAYSLYDDVRFALQNNRHPKLKAYVVWDNETSSSQDDRVGFDADGNPDPIEQQHYNTLANDPLLSGEAYPEPSDQTPPTLTRTSPAAGAVVDRTVSVTGIASDQGALESVELLVDGVPTGRTVVGGTENVALAWDTRAVRNGRHTLRLRARDNAGNVGFSDLATVRVDNAVRKRPPPAAPPAAGTPTRTRPRDVVTPTGPGVLAWLSGGRQVTVTWGRSRDNVGVAGYRVHRNGALIADVSARSRRLVDRGLDDAAVYSYRVSAYDATGNVSRRSSPVVFRTPDLTAPTSPGRLRAAPGTRSVALTWAPARDNRAVAHYFVFRGNSKYRLLGRTTRFVDTGLRPGRTYTYKVYAIDAAGHWSKASRHLSVTAR